MQQSTSIWFDLGQLLQQLVLELTGMPWLASLAQTLLGIVGIFAVVMLAALILVYLERKVCAWMQMRIGPNRLGPFGIFVGAFAGAVAGELLHRRGLTQSDLGQAARVGVGTWLGIVLGMALKLALIFPMLAVFALAWWIG